MLKPKRAKKGIALIVMLASLFIVIILANVMLTIMTSQSRLTHHQISRVQGYYAAQAGTALAFDKLRRADDGNWPNPQIVPGQFYTHTLCNTTLTPGCGDIDEPNLPASVQNVLIAVAYRGIQATDASGKPIGGCNPCTPVSSVNTCICSRATFAYP